MYRAHVVLCAMVCAAGCSFETASFPAGSGNADAAVDAPIGIDARPAPDAGMTFTDADIADGPVSDAADLDAAPPGEPDAPERPDAALPRPDARPQHPDARSLPDARPPDAPTGPCPTKATPLELAIPTAGTLSGPSRYTPTCAMAGTSGPEDFFHLDVSSPTATELVVDLDDVDTLDGVVDVTTDCKSASGIGLCSSVGAPGAGEVVVVPRAVDGLYIAVDSIGAGGGAYVLTAFIRAVVAKGVACDPALVASRCQLGDYCLDKDNDGVALCEMLTPSVSTPGGTLATACANAIVATEDTAVIGSFGTATGMSIVALKPPRTGHVRAVVDDGLGGCAVDTVLEVMSGATCATASTLVASDDNSGLGPCPRLEAVPVTKNQMVWLHLRVAEGAPLPAGATYSLVIDYD